MAGAAGQYLYYVVFPIIADWPASVFWQDISAEKGDAREGTTFSLVSKNPKPSILGYASIPFPFQYFYFSRIPAPHRGQRIICSVSIALTDFFWPHRGQINITLANRAEDECIRFMWLLLPLLLH